MLKKSSWAICLALLTLLVACGGETPTAIPQPTAAPTSEPTLPPAEEPTSVPTATSLPDPTAAPTTAPEPTAEPTAAPITDTATIEPIPADEANFEFNGIQLTYPAGLFTTLTGLEQAAVSAEFGMPYWSVYPAYDQLNVEGYLLAETFHEPRLEIYPARDYADVNLEARLQIQALQTLLDNSPELSQEENLPFIPLFNAAQVFHTQEEYLSFQNGRGIRYISYYSQAVNPIGNRDLFYTFQGLTNDGEYYISAIFPIATASLPDEGVVPGDDYEKFSEEYSEYLDGIITGLTALTPADFNPPLTSLDQLLQSLVITREPAPKKTDANGNLLLTIAHPIDKAAAFTGQPLTVEGYVNPAQATSVELMILGGPAVLITSTATVDPTSGDWSAVITVPTQYEGTARLVATTNTEAVTHQIDLARDYNAITPAVAIDLFAPSAGATLVAKSYAFFNGRVQSAVNSTITIALLMNNCTEFVARQSFTVGGGEWYGQLLIPENTAGPACMVAYTGEFGTAGSMAVAYPAQVVSATDESAPPLTLGYVPFSAPAGTTLDLYGSAINAPDGLVSIQVSTYPAGASEPTVLTTFTATVDEFNYWFATYTIPAEQTDMLLITVTVPGTDPAQVQYQTSVSIER